MAAGLLLGPWIFDADGDGAPYVGGLLTTYVSGTTTPQATYTTAALTVPHPNPIVADADGRFPDIWADTSELFALKWEEPDGTDIATYSDRQPLGPADDASFALADLSNVTAADFMDAMAGASGYSAFINRVVNPTARIDQRLAGAGATLSNSAEVYGLDRFKGRRGASQTATLQQSSGGPTVFGPSATSYCAKFTVGTGAAPGASDQVFTETDIEGYHISDALLGQSGAKNLAIRFWALCSIAGKQSFALQNSARDRSYVSTYTIATAGSWQEFTFNIPGDQTGTWLVTNGVGLRLVWDCGSGSNYEGAADAWAAADRRRTSDSVKVGSVSSATLAVTGVQVVVVSDSAVEPPFTVRPYAQELQLCQRYYLGLASAPIGNTINSSQIGGAVFHPVSMRVAPSLSTTSFAVGGGSAGAAALLTASPTSSNIYNVSANWSTGTNVQATGGLDADFY